MSDVNIDIGSSFNAQGVNAAVSSIDKLAQAGDRYANSAQEIAQANQTFYNSQNKNTTATLTNVRAMQSSLSTGGKYQSYLIDAARAAGLNANQTFNMASASGLWTQKQLAAANASDLLTRRAERLTQAVAGGRITAEQAGKSYQAYANEQARVAASSQTMVERFQGLKASIGPYVQMAGVALGATYAVGKAVEQAWNFSNEGAQVLRLGESFKSVAQSYGVSSQDILLSMRRASRGTIADTDLMLSANRAMLLGVSTDADELGKITEVAIARGRAMGLSSSEAIDRVFTGIGRLSPKILDDLGIITNATQRYEEYAEAHNMSADAIDDFTKREIIKNAIIEGSQDLVADMNNDKASSYEALGASWTNYVNSLKMEAAGTFVGANGGLAGVLQSGADTNAAQMAEQDNEGAYQSYLLSQGVNINDIRGKGREGKFKRDAQAWQAQNKRSAEQSNYYRTQAEQAGGGNVISGQFAPQSYTANVDNVLTLSTGLTQVNANTASSQEEINEAFSDGQYVTALYREDIADLTAQARAGTITWQEYSKEVKDLQTSFQDGSYAVNAQREATQALGQQTEDAFQNIAMSALQANEATSQQMLDFALASGSITQEAYNQGMAQEKLAQAYVGGSLNAQTYAANVAELMNKVSGMDGVTANMYIDIWIREHGGARLGMVPTSTSGNPNFSQQGLFGAASGGQLQAGQWTLVGDRMGGALTPYSELISPTGYVIDAKTTQRLFEMGLVDDNVKSLYTGSDDVLSGGNFQAVKPRPRPPGGYRGGGTRVRPNRGTESFAATETAVPEAQNTAIQIANLTANLQNSIEAGNATVDNALRELISVMKAENPRAIGKQVGYELAKAS